MSEALPIRVIAGIPVPDTPLIDSAIALARAHLNEIAYNHVLRSFLFGFCIADKLTNLTNRDREVHAVAAILHDLGWDQSGAFISPDKRFEVDGAIAARGFLEQKAPSSEWDEHRMQLVWDAIALHTTPSIAAYKEPEVAACSLGIGADFRGPDGSPSGSLTWDEYNAIVKEYPRTGFIDCVTDIFCGLCKTKASTTYDNLVAQVGEAYVDGYSVQGKTCVDLFKASKEALG